ncbi:hypothetical protein GGR54DRAFT_616891 [Hypoxylon sp. NC1633]|nr:hypothetical protein GGR54DRAFT_616891 [Hypoxylon sp. NC1633]
MSQFSCNHTLPRSRVGAHLSHIPQDASRRCPDCQTSTPEGTLALLQKLQRIGESAAHLVFSERDADVDQHLSTYLLDRIASQRKNSRSGFKQAYASLLAAWGRASYLLLTRPRLSSVHMTARGKYGSDVARQALRALGVAALEASGVALIDTAPESGDEEDDFGGVLVEVNRMIMCMRERASAIERFDQLEVIFDGALTLKGMRDEVVFAVSRLDEGFARWDASARK